MPPHVATNGPPERLESRTKESRGEFCPWIDPRDSSVRGLKQKDELKLVDLQLCGNSQCPKQWQHD
jgi:hypothetical protein